MQSDTPTRTCNTCNVNYPATTDNYNIDITGDVCYIECIKCIRERCGAEKRKLQNIKYHEQSKTEEYKLKKQLRNKKYYAANKHKQQEKLTEELLIKRRLTQKLYYANNKDRIKELKRLRTVASVT